MKPLYFFFLFIFLYPTLTFSSNYSDTLLDCEFLFDENIAESIFSWLTSDVPLVRDFIPETQFLQMYKEDKYNYCLEIVSSEELTKTEKKVRNAQLFNLDSREFKFGIIDSYHKNLDIENITFGNEINSNIIKNFGYKFVTLNPSVLIDETIFISPKTNSVRSYSFEIDVPKPFVASSHPETLNGFCAIAYDNIRTDIKETLFFNNQMVKEPYETSFSGRGNFTDILIDDIETDIEEGEITINSNLEVDSSYNIKYSIWNPYCCASSESGCIQFCFECVENNVELITDKAIITDNYYVTRYSPKLQDQYEIWHEDGLLWVRLFIDDIDKYKRVMIDRFLEIENYYSVLRYKFEPHDFLYFEAVPFVESEYKRLNETITENVSSRNYIYKSPLIRFEDNSIVFATKQMVDELKIEFETFFDSEGFFNFGNEKLTYTIDLNRKEPFRNILLKKNNIFYRENETIKITPILLTENGMYIDDLLLIYDYGSGSQSIMTRTNQSVEFDYKGEGKIILEYFGNDQYYKSIEKTNIIRRPFILHFFFKLIGI